MIYQFHEHIFNFPIKTKQKSYIDCHNVEAATGGVV